MQYMWPRVTNLCPFRSTISRFQDVAHFRRFPLIPMLKFQSAAKFLIFGKSPIYTHNFAFGYDCLIYHKVWLRLDKSRRRSSVLKLPGPIWSCVNKNMKVPQHFAFLLDRKNIHNFIFPQDHLIYHKVWLRSDENWRTSILKCLLTWGPMLTKTKNKIRKNLKMVWRYGREGATIKFGLDPCGVRETWVYGRRTDGRTPAPRQYLCWQSQAELKIRNAPNDPKLA